MASSSSSSVSSSSTLPWKHDVFLSFRGVDTRKNFTDHLYTALKQRGIITFRDDERLERGEEIEPSLLKAIEDSRFAIVIFSRRYADSTWCLEELAKILDCHEERGQTVLPIFYDVTPSEVQEKTGGFGVDLDKHEEAFKDNKEKVKKWRLALTKVGNLSGWDVADKHQSEIVAKIVDTILSGDQPTFSDVLEDLVGMDSRLKKLKDYLTTARDDVVKFIGIHGMGGIGKTTMARILFDEFKSQYDGSCFLADIRKVTDKDGLICLQKQLLSEILKEKGLKVRNDFLGAAQIKKRVKCKKVFLVFDDVDKQEQLEKLARKHDWFGDGSIIIITSRDKKLLTNHGVDYIHEVEELYDNDAHRLLLLKAFKKTSPTDEHLGLAGDVIRYAEGLPLAIEVLGGHLCDEGIESWKGLLVRLKEIPDPDIIKSLRISYDGLQHGEKKLFLDIACFFKGKPINWVKNILGKSDYEINKLREKSLIKFFDDELWMHDLIQEMGWEIVHEEHANEPGRRSRLWTFKDFCHIATKNTATEMVEGIMVDDPPKKPLRLNGKIFSSMYNLRLLKISNVHFVKGLTFLSSDLRLLEWPEYPEKWLPQSFEADNLVELKMSNSNVKYLWKGIKWCMMLKTIDLCHSCNLTETPDFTGTPNLEYLVLEDCARLHKVHESVGNLSKLIELNLNYCESLVSLPNKVSGMKSLRILALFYCSKLEKLPSDVEEVECLEELDVGGTALREWLSFIVRKRKLDSLSPNDGMLMPMRKMELPPLFQSLKRLCLRYLNLGILPDSIGSMLSLERLDLSRNNFVSLPESMSQLSKLQYLCLDRCEELQSINHLSLSARHVSICARECTSLSAIVCPIFSYVGSVASEKHNHCELNFLNCKKLLKNQNKTYDEIVTGIQQWIQAIMKYVHLDWDFIVIVPGSDIPYWINDWSDVDTITIKQPPKLLGLFVCAIIQPHKVYGPQEHYWSVNFKAHTRVRGYTYITMTIFICDHLFLTYIPVLDNELGQDVEATCETEGPITVKKWGIKPVYFEDLENTEETSNIGRVYEPAQDETDLPSFEVLDEP